MFDSSSLDQHGMLSGLTATLKTSLEFALPGGYDKDGKISLAGTTLTQVYIIIFVYQKALIQTFHHISLFTKNNLCQFTTRELKLQKVILYSITGFKHIFYWYKKNLSHPVIIIKFKRYNSILEEQI